jgi:hypothetical protein
MKLLLIALQIQSCLSPAIYPIVAGAQNQSTPSIIYFNCVGLGNSPALINVNCPNQLYIPSAIPGQSMYMGLQNGILRVSAPFTVTCTNCIQQGLPTPQIGEYQIGIYTIGQGMQWQWTGIPALPNLNIIGCNLWTASYAPGTITINCTQ